MAKAKVQKHEETPEGAKTAMTDPAPRRLTTDDFVRRPGAEIFKDKVAEWRSDFLVKGAL